MDWNSSGEMSDPTIGRNGPQTTVNASFSGYEPGGRRFESCRARHSLREWLCPAISSSPLDSLRSSNRWTSPAGRANRFNELAPLPSPRVRTNRTALGRSQPVHRSYTPGRSHRLGRRLRRAGSRPRRALDPFLQVPLSELGGGRDRLGDVIHDTSRWHDRVSAPYRVHGATKKSVWVTCAIRQCVQTFQ